MLTTKSDILPNKDFLRFFFVFSEREKNLKADDIFFFFLRIVFREWRKSIEISLTSFVKERAKLNDEHCSNLASIQKMYFSNPNAIYWAAKNSTTDSSRNSSPWMNVQRILFFRIIFLRRALVSKRQLTRRNDEQEIQFEAKE